MSSVQFQQTINCPVVCAGVGVHSGERARIVMKPAQPGTGIRFRRSDITDRDNVIVARGDRVSEVQLGTTLRNEAGVTVATVEHLLAACAGVGVDNLIIEIDGPEVPIMDGSSAVYCELLLSAGLRRQGALRRRIRILDTVEVGDGVKTARLAPSADDYLSIHARIEFESRAIGTQQMSLRLLPGMFARDIAFARTFGFAQDVEKLQAMGLARGGSLENAVVLDGDKVVNPEGLRSGDEFIRHKILDAVGDLMLAGAPIAGVYEARQPGHALNNKLVRALLETPSAWCWETDELESLAQTRATALSR
ncbi:UDP-3-O-acyl-N-acetylglucosamine deacetylase [Henriciella aquimarina]|uniref:UDP-3-O-acyl-N-acetylglucosamine deacetylase n=1 Tax=Henriciella aquimarina TaxID=545261 RepID=UPI000A025378|nr:UDP-3-O-acyl-N-acetylglucosamine deacetylase [Henriciella aquimarina]